MTLVHSDEWLDIHQGDCREVMADLPEKSVHAVVTSPPFWGLRNYKLTPSVWSGDASHDHEWVDEGTRRKGSTNGRSDLGSTLISAGGARYRRATVRRTQAGWRPEDDQHVLRDDLRRHGDGRQAQAVGLARQHRAVQGRPLRWITQGFEDRGPVVEVVMPSPEVDSTCSRPA